MNSKRSRSKLYRLIDTFFILAPILIMVFYFVGSIFVIGYSNYSTGVITYFSEFLEYFDLPPILDFFHNQLFEALIFDFEIGGFIVDIQDFVYNILIFFVNFEGDPNFVLVLADYTTYVIFYELFSLMINVIMWLPRYLRNWVQEKTDTLI